MADADSRVVAESGLRFSQVMTLGISRRAFLAGLSSSVAVPAFAETALAPGTSLRPLGRGEDFLRRTLRPVDRLLADAGLSGNVSFAVADLRTGASLESRGAKRVMPPASVAKALTAVYALATLGPGYQFTTEIVATGGVSDGVVGGDLVLAGGGDPTLDTDALAGLARRLKDAGIREVKGRFLVWGGALPRVEAIDPMQPDHVGYSPAVSGLNLNFNRVHFEWRKAGSDYKVTMDARSEAYRPEVRFARMGVVSRSVPIYTYSGSNGRDNWTVARAALGNGGARWLPVRRPELYAGEVFQTFARSHGIVLKAPVVADARPEGQVLARHDSASLRIILRDMLRYSTNLTAEVVGLAATRARGVAATTLAQSAGVMNTWLRDRYSASSIAQVDHSGLGDASRISASDMVRVLVQVNREMGLRTILRPIAMRDEKRRVVEDHPVTVQAKTGTLNFVSGLAGYMTIGDGRELAFAIFAADLDRRAGISRSEMERPPGGKAWNTRSRKLQQALIDRWDILLRA